MDKKRNLVGKISSTMPPIFLTGRYHGPVGRIPLSIDRSPLPHVPRRRASYYIGFVTGTMPPPRLSVKFLYQSNHLCMYHAALLFSSTTHGFSLQVPCPSLPVGQIYQSPLLFSSTTTPGFSYTCPCRSAKFFNHLRMYHAPASLHLPCPGGSGQFIFPAITSQNVISCSSSQSALYTTTPGFRYTYHARSIYLSSK